MNPNNQSNPDFSLYVAPLSFVCPVARCEMKVSSKAELDSHIKSNHNLFPCLFTFCHQVYNNPEAADMCMFHHSIMTLINELIARRINLGKIMENMNQIKLTISKEMDDIDRNSAQALHLYETMRQRLIADQQKK